MVFVFQKPREAQKFFGVLPKRLDKYGYSITKNAYQVGRTLPTYKFLGFVCYWGQTRNGYWRLKYTSRLDCFTAKIRGLRKFLWDNLNTNDVDGLLKTVIWTIRR